MVIDPEANDNANYIGHFHGPNRNFEERTGYAHNTKTFDSVQTIVSKILEVGLNVMILNRHNNKIIYIDDGRFTQR